MLVFLGVSLDFLLCAKPYGRLCLPFRRNVLVVADKTILSFRRSVVLKKMSVKTSAHHVGLKFRSGVP